MTTEASSDETVAWSLPNVRTVDAWAIGAVILKIAKVNVKAAKLGVPAFTYTVSAPRLVKVPEPEGLGLRSARYKEVVDITIKGEPVQVSGYRFLGRIDFEDGMTLVSARPGEDVPARYRSATQECDHCASRRRRSKLFIFRRDGGEQHIQVGRSCLKDFMGHDPAQVLWSARLWGKLCADIDDVEMRGGVHGSPMMRVDDVLAMAAAVVRTRGGFVSRAQETSTEGRTPATAGLVFEQMHPPLNPPRGWVTITPTKDDEQRAAEAKVWAFESMIKSDQSDYEYNLVTLLKQEAVHDKRMGMLASLIGAYARHLGEVVAKARRVDAHVGTVGERGEFTAVFSGSSKYDNAYGTCFIGRFDTPQGLLVYKGSSPFWALDSKAGDVFRLSAAIKAHDEYKGTKQTIIQRVKVLEEAVA